MIASTSWTIKSIDNVIKIYQSLIFHKCGWNNIFPQYSKFVDVNNRDCFQACKHVVIISLKTNFSIHKQHENFMSHTRIVAFYRPLC
jgi:hypothetical protein